MIGFLYLFKLVSDYLAMSLVSLTETTQFLQKHISKSGCPTNCGLGVLTSYLPPEEGCSLVRKGHESHILDPL